MTRSHGTTRSWRVAVAAITLTAGLACEDAAAPTSPSGPALDFTVEAAARVLAKRVVPVTARLTRARSVEFPLTFVFEKQNLNESAVIAARRTIDRPDEGEITIHVAVRKDPVVRVTLVESGPRALSVTKSVQIDVLTFSE